MKTITLLLCLALTNAAASAAIPIWGEEITALSRDFDAAITSAPGDAQTKTLDRLLIRAIALQEHYPERGLAHAWVGWTQFELAVSATDLPTKFSLFQEALANQETAIETEPRCCGAEIYVTLAGLYQAPALGNNSERVRRTFDKALEIAPDNLLALTRYAQYLTRSGDYEVALKYANAAVTAPALTFSRPGQDKVLRETARDLIEQINDRIKRRDAANAPK